MSQAFGSMFDEKTNPRGFFALMSIICLVTPFLILYWLVPLFSTLTIGNDYVSFPIEHQMALMFSLENGSFPLYVPGFAMGQSAMALTLGQLYHPLSHLATLFPGYWDGNALTINTQLRLLSIGIAQLVLIYALRTLGLRAILAFVLSFVCLYNLRMLDMFRYGSSLENYTAFIMLCSFIILSFTQFKKRYFSGIAISSYLLTVGGHPQIAYIGFIGAAILTLITPSFVSAIQVKYAVKKERLILYWTLVLAATIVGTLLAAPYAFGFYFDFLPHNAIRTNNTYEWAIAYQDSWGGLFRSFFAPLASNVHGAFGGSSLIILALLFPLATVFFRQQQASLWLVFVVALFAFLVSAGDATSVHRIVWEYLPMASNFRVPGRFAMMMIFPMLFLLIWILSRDETGENAKPVVPVLKSNIALVCLIAAGLLLMLNVSFDHMFPEATWPTPDHINDVTKAIMTKAMYLGIAVLLIAAVYFELIARKIEQGASLVGLVLVAVMMFEAANTLRYGTWVEEGRPYKTNDEFLAQIQEQYYVPAVPGNGLSMALMDEQMHRSMFENRIARFYQTVTAIETEEELESYLITKRMPNEAVVLAPPTLSLLSEGAENTEQSIDSIRLLEYRYNQFVYEVDASKAGLLSTNLPYRENWQAFVDDEQQQIFMANGYEAAVFLPAGKHRVVIRYQSKETEAGVIVACLVLLMILVFFIWNAQSKQVRVGLAVACVLPVMFYSWWSASLYGGQSLDIAYEWDSTELPPSNNLSYGKQATSSLLYNTQMSYYFYAGAAINGDLGGSGFVTANLRMPHWKVDLGGVYQVESIKIHKLLQGSLPAVVWGSMDNQSFQPISRITRSDFGEEIVITPEKPLSARYVAIRLERNGILGFHEFEVFGQKAPDQEVSLQENGTGVKPD